MIYTIHILKDEDDIVGWIPLKLHDTYGNILIFYEAREMLFYEAREMLFYEAREI
jgi:hypothetical protein